MTTTLVVVQAAGGTPTADELALLAVARGLGDEVVAAWFAHPPPRLVDDLGRHGADRVLVLDHPALAQPLPQPRAAALAGILPELGADTVLLATSVLSLDVAADLAARTDGGLNWDLVGVAREGDRLLGTRLAANDTLQVTVGWRGLPRIALFRPGSVEPQAEWGPAEVDVVAPDVEESATRVRLVRREPAAAAEDGLEQAEVVVAGGRGLGEAENFALLEELAHLLDGRVGATRAVVEAGWYSREAQIGQTGATVSPHLYLACGISGAIHHKVGMQRSETVIAINTDPQAPIFDLCHLAVVGDALAILPELIAALRDGVVPPDA